MAWKTTLSSNSKWMCFRVPTKVSRARKSISCLNWTKQRSFWPFLREKLNLWWRICRIPPENCKQIKEKWSAFRRSTVIERRKFSSSRMIWPLPKLPRMTLRSNWAHYKSPTTKLRNSWVRLRQIMTIWLTNCTKWTRQGTIWKPNFQMKCLEIATWTTSSPWKKKLWISSESKWKNRIGRLLN